MSNLLKGILMLCALAGLAGALYFLEKNKPVSPEVFSEVGSADDVLKFYVQQGEGSSKEGLILFSRQGSAFVLSEPVSVPVDSGVVEQMVESLPILKAIETVPAGEREDELSAYGFEKPEAYVGVMTVDQKLEALVGKLHPLGDMRYMAREDLDQIYLVPEELYAKLNKTLFDVRDKKPIKISKDEVKSLSVYRNQLGVLNFFKDKHWTLKTESGRIRADEELMEKNIEDLLTLEVASFVDKPDDNLRFYGLEEPKFEVQLSTIAEGQTSVGSEDKTITFSLGEVLRGGLPQTYLKLKGEDRLYNIQTNRFSDFMQSAGHFRDRTPFAGVTREQLKEVTVRRFWPGGELRDAFSVEQQESGAFAIKGKPLKLKEWNSWLDELVGLRVLSYVDEVVVDEEKRHFQIEISGVGSITFRGSVLGQEIRKGILTTAPRYASIVLEDGTPATAIVSAAAYDTLYQGEEFFQ